MKYVALVIEDDEDLSYIFSKALQAVGFEVEPIRDGGKALARIAEGEPPALVVLDMHLPHLSGINVLRQIAAEPRLANTRVMVATADAVLADQVRDKADVVLVKPISFTQMSDLAARLVPSASRKGASDGNAGPGDPSASSVSG